MARPKLVRHRHGVKRYTTKQLAESHSLQLSSTAPAPHRTWETFTIGVRSIEGVDGYDLTFDRAEAERLLQFLREHLDAVLPK